MDKQKIRQAMEGFCLLCPRCDGRHCKGQIPGMGGTETATTFLNNVKALEEISLHMSVLPDMNGSPSTKVNLLGYDLDFPILPAPMSGVVENMAKNTFTEPEYGDAVLQGAKNAGTIGTTGDGAKDFFFKNGVEAIARMDGYGIPFIKPWDDNLLKEKIDYLQSLKTKVAWIGMDIDAIGLSNVTFMGGSIPLRSNKEVEKVIQNMPYPMIIKGIMTIEDCEKFIDMGAKAIVVSNHGGRILDYGVGTATMLPRIAEKVAGRIPVLVDGGVRSGVDVFKMLALGADGVLVGRPTAWSIMDGGATGLTEYLLSLQNSLKKTMSLTGAKSIKDISSSMLYRD